MFSVMWSEHCSYKSSRPLLATLPSGGRGVVAGPGENAGVVAHRRRPGGRLQARVAQPPQRRRAVPGRGDRRGRHPARHLHHGRAPHRRARRPEVRRSRRTTRTRHLVRGVVRGVGGYGNCVGVPTVGGELVFHPSYARQPAGQRDGRGPAGGAPPDARRGARPGQPGGALRLGHRSRRHRRGAASWPAPRSTTRAPPSAPGPGRRPLRREAAHRGQPGARSSAGSLEGLQDLGAAGITCAVVGDGRPGGHRHRSSTSTRSRAARRAWTPFEVMISESQERMLAIVRPERLADVRDVCARWGSAGGGDRPGHRATASSGSSRAALALTASPRRAPRELARIPAAALTSDAIVYQRDGAPPAHRRAAPAPGAPEVHRATGLPERGMDPGPCCWRCWATPNLASRAWVTTQYDATVGARYGRRRRARRRGAAHQGHAQGRWSWPPTPARAVGALDPYLGAALAVAECTRNVAITGARPLGVTNCLNFGDPERPEAFWHFSEAVRGLARRLPRPGPAGHRRQRQPLQRVAAAGAIAPTAQIGVVGLLDDVDAPRRAGLPRGGRRHRPARRDRPGPGRLGLRGAGRRGARRPTAGPRPGPRGAPCRALLVAGRRRSGLLRSAQDVSGGGLAVAVAEGCIWSATSARSWTCRRLDAGPRALRRGAQPGRREHPTRRPGDGSWRLAAEHGVPLRRLGRPAATGCASASSGQGATGRRGGARRRRRRRPRRAARRAAPCLGVGPAAGARRGRPSASRPIRWRSPIPPARSIERCAASSASTRPATRRRALAALGLFALQHRGQESAGVAVSDGEAVMVYKDLGLVAQVLDEQRLPSLRGDLAIAHCRYSTTGSTRLGEQPADASPGPAAHGRHRPQRQPRQHPRAAGAICPAAAAPDRHARDTELLTALLAEEPGDGPRGGAAAGSCPRSRAPTRWWSWTSERVIGVRDPHGFRPLVLGRLPARRIRPRTHHHRGGRVRREPDSPGLWAGRLAGRRAGAAPPRGLGARVGDGGPRHPRRRVRARRGARRDGRAGRARRAALGPLRARATSTSASSS